MLCPELRNRKNPLQQEMGWQIDDERKQDHQEQDVQRRGQPALGLVSEPVYPVNIF
jgi:hypothetical protein